MASLRGMDRFFFKGPPLRCPDCGEETVFNSGSFLGEIHNDSQVTPDTLDRLYADCFEDEEVFCRKCDYTEPMLFWVQHAEGEIAGPLCGTCLCKHLCGEIGGDRDLTEDYRVFWIRNNPKTKEQIREVAEYFAAMDAPVEQIDEVEELDVLDLF